MMDVFMNFSNMTIRQLNFSLSICDETHIFMVDGNESFIEDIRDFLNELKKEEEEEHVCFIMFHKWLPAMLICLMVLGIVFNGFTLLTFIQLPRVRSFTNHFVASLALADLLMVVLNPILFLLLIYEKIEFEIGDTLRFNSEIFCAMASLFSFASISVDRMIAIGKPLYHRTLPRSRCRKVIVFIWIFCGIATILDYFLSIVVDNFLITCGNFGFGFVLPALISIISYAIIARVVLCRRKTPIAASQATNHYCNTRARHTIRITWKILIVILPGIIMWGFFWVSEFISYNEEVRLSLTFFEIRSLVPMLTAVVNPLIFILMTSEFQKYLFKLFLCRRRIDIGMTSEPNSNNSI